MISVSLHNNCITFSCFCLGTRILAMYFDYVMKSMEYIYAGIIHLLLEDKQQS